MKEWDPLAKARYVRQLVERASEEGLEVDLAEIARKIGSRRDYVERLLGGLRVHEHVAEKNFYELRDVDESVIDFSVLTTALSYEAISDFVGLRGGGDTASKLNDQNLKDLVDWTYRERPSGTTVLGESRNLRKLAEVVKSDRALEALRGGATLDAAAEFSEEASVVFRGALNAAIGSLSTARDYVHRVNAPARADVDSASEASRLAKVFRQPSRRSWRTTRTMLEMERDYCTGKTAPEPGHTCLGRLCRTPGVGGCGRAGVSG